MRQRCPCGLYSIELGSKMEKICEQWMRQWQGSDGGHEMKDERRLNGDCYHVHQNCWKRATWISNLRGEHSWIFRICLICSVLHLLQLDLVGIQPCYSDIWFEGGKEQWYHGALVLLHEVSFRYLCPRRRIKWMIDAIGSRIALSLSVIS